MDVIVSLEDVRATDARAVGAKAANLGELMAAGFTVPSGFVVTADAHRCVRGNVVPAQFLRPLATAYAKLGRRVGQPDPRVAVRSSVVGEDARGVAFAGVYRSVTNVRGVTAVTDAIERCWWSLHGERAIAYRTLRGIKEPRVMAVIVQAMVRAARGGVAFSVDPTGRDPDMALIEASFGHVASVVSGLVEPDTYRLTRRNARLVAVRVGDKASEIVPSRDGEVSVSVTPARRRSRALEQAEASQIVEMALAVERHMGTPQDVEWCYDAAGDLFLLQARPVPAPIRRRAAALTTGAVMAMGAGASPGVAIGRARVLAMPEEADDLDSGDVLVATTPDPGWVGVLGRVAAVVSDRGGVTSHLAVASRELGIPCVVGTRSATLTIHTGDLVAVDGTEGMVRSTRADAAAVTARGAR